MWILRNWLVFASIIEHRQYILFTITGSMYVVCVCLCARWLASFFPFIPHLHHPLTLSLSLFPIFLYTGTVWCAFRLSHEDECYNIKIIPTLTFDHPTKRTNLHVCINFCYQFNCFRWFHQKSIPPHFIEYRADYYRRRDRKLIN